MFKSDFIGRDNVYFGELINPLEYSFSPSEGLKVLTYRPIRGVIFKKCQDKAIDLLFRGYQYPILELSDEVTAFNSLMISDYYGLSYFLELLNSPEYLSNRELRSYIKMIFSKEFINEISSVIKKSEESKSSEKFMMDGLDDFKYLYYLKRFSHFDREKAFPIYNVIINSFKPRLEEKVSISRVK